VTDPRLALIGIGAILLQAIVVPLIQRCINRITRRRIVAERAATGATFAATMHDPGARFREALADSREAYRERMRMNLWKAALKSGLRFGDNLAVMCVLGIGGALVVQGETTLGVVVAFLSGLKRLNEPWQTLVTFYRDFADAQVKYDLVRAAMAPRVPMPGGAPGAVSPPA
jgi:ABC-type bacteriocin/lantibiotic exporter with double-glycine peptidase domain